MPEFSEVEYLRRAIEELSRSTVSKDVYDSDQRGVSARIAVLEKEVTEQEARTTKAEERRASDRRLILASLLLPIIASLVVLYVTSQLGAVPS